MYAKSLDMLRSVRNATLSMTADLTQQQSEFVPAPGKWSAGQVLDHLRLADDLYRVRIARMIELEKSGQRPVVSDGFQDINTSVAYIPKAALPLLEIPFTIFNMFIPPFLRDIMTEFRLLPAQNPDVAKPKSSQPVEELRTALKLSLERIADLLATNPNIDYRRLRYRHPLMGDNNLLVLLRIIASHERRHQSQIRDIFKRRDFPRAA